MVVSSELRRHRLDASLDLSEALGDSVLQSVSIGYDGDTYALVVDPPYEYRHDGIGYPELVGPLGTDKSLSYSIIRINDQTIERVKLKGQGTQYRYAQPLPGDELLAVAPRAREHRDIYYDLPVALPHSRDDRYDDSDPLEWEPLVNEYEDHFNGHIFSKNGGLLRKVALSDAIESVQTTVNGDIWVAYFDEAFGNSNYAHGIAKWGSDGNKHYQCHDRTIVDCYALNVFARSEAWFYYYTDFELVHLTDDREVNYWKVPVAGSHAFAIWKGRALFNGGYHNDHKYVLLDLKDDHTMSELARYAFINDDSGTIQADRVVMRGSQVVLLKGKKLYRLFMHEL